MAENGVYLDYLGAGRPFEGQLEAVFQQLLNCGYLANPHSRNAASRQTTELIENARHRILSFLNTDREHYSVIFTSGTTAALKLLAETFVFKDERNGKEELSSGKASHKKDQKITSKVSDNETSEQSRILGLREIVNNENSCFVYTQDNHTSVLGMREMLQEPKPEICCVFDRDIDEKEVFIDQMANKRGNSNDRCLFVYPAMSNFNGRKYPLSWVQKLKAARKMPESTSAEWFVCVDAASFLCCDQLDLSQNEPDFVTLSFYKIFGHPTGLGALLVHKNAESALKKKYFGGGTVQMSLPGQLLHQFKPDIVERFEDGTINFHGILALTHGFDAIERVGGIKVIHEWADSLAEYTVSILRSFQHSNRNPVVLVYDQHTVSSSNQSKQGPVCNFNLLRADGSFVGYTEVEKMAELYNIHLRTGCFCNQGACQLYLGLNDQTVIDNFKSGKTCGDLVDVINGQPVGSVRISFGYQSLIDDAQKFLGMIYDCFCVPSARTFNDYLANIPVPVFHKNTPTPLITNEMGNQANIEKYYISPVKSEFPEISPTPEPKTSEKLVENSKIQLVSIMLYPIKSAAPLRVPKWSLCETGLEFDRTWLLADRNGVTMTQKRYPKMCQLHATVDFENGQLALDYKNPTESDIPTPANQRITVPLELTNQQRLLINNGDSSLSSCEHTICSDRVNTIDCGDTVSDWLSLAFNSKQVRLARQKTETEKQNAEKNYSYERTDVNESQISLANQAQILLINLASVRTLLETIHKDGASNLNAIQLAERFRPNFIVDNGTRPFEEDNWTHVRIGNTQFETVGKCHRCQMICIDQVTGVKNPKILTALRDYRKGQMTFGIYMKISSDKNNADVSKEISTDDPVQVIIGP